MQLTLVVTGLLDIAPSLLAPVDTVAPAFERLLAAAEFPSRETRGPAAALGKPLLAFMPSGTDAARWQRWQNETQMLLFEHPVNVAREAAGRAPVNGVWVWGGGEPVKAPAHPRIAAPYSD